MPKVSPEQHLQSPLPSCAFGVLEGLPVFVVCCQDSVGDAVIIDRAFLVEASVLVLAQPEKILGGQSKVVDLQRISPGAVVQELDALGADIVDQREAVRDLCI